MAVITVAEMETARLEATEYINDLLSEFLAKTLNIEVSPSWDFGPVWPPVYYPSVKKILVPEAVVVLWAKDRDKTKLALRWAMGHEFWHYVQEVRGERGVPILSFPWIAQKIAEKQAVRLSGITAVEGERLWRELLRRECKTLSSTVELTDRKSY